MALRIITNTAVARFRALTGEQRRAVMTQLANECCTGCWEDKPACRCQHGIVLQQPEVSRMIMFQPVLSVAAEPLTVTRDKYAFTGGDR